MSDAMPDPYLAAGARTSPEMRREAVRRRVAESGFVRVDVLAGEFGVSIMTVHRDLDELEERGFLRKVRGGATSAPTATFHGDLPHRMQAEQAEKQALAAAALADEVYAGQVVALDDSTTALALARLLPEKAPLTVVTHFLPVVRALAGRAGVEVIGLGGRYDPAYDSFLGQATAEAAADLRTDLLVMSTTAVTDGVCYIQSQDTVITRRALIASAARTVALVDHTKFAKRALHRLVELSTLDRVLVDSATPSAVVSGLRARGARIDIVALP
ncbi:DeoR/GlpR family DNA-binding transcription regulator [Pseudonocardia alaniniphila]|uniref:Lactose phosphotransferase system repressor n=1 Tax=Pseudonocardia alaniniphila TaxID=75291 RepID=A0ABS9TNL3_9PSEU|nr:DeoR/GlpR family DNA-binding transcription regulator [Pseudonocardia alaniniphila]MCH6170125.1 DeoR/GlpR family DNA-binding transcription regulator [Pseudonocardia alaniniphila]